MRAHKKINLLSVTLLILSRLTIETLDKHENR
jgi:hypothetical protein